MYIAQNTSNFPLVKPDFAGLCFSSAGRKKETMRRTALANLNSAIHPHLSTINLPRIPCCLFSFTIFLIYPEETEEWKERRGEARCCWLSVSALPSSLAAAATPSIRNWTETRDHAAGRPGTFANMLREVQGVSVIKISLGLIM